MKKLIFIPFIFICPVFIGCGNPSNTKKENQGKPEIKKTFDEITEMRESKIKLTHAEKIKWIKEKVSEIDNLRNCSTSSATVDENTGPNPRRNLEVRCHNDTVINETVEGQAMDINRPGGNYTIENYYFNGKIFFTYETIDSDNNWKEDTPLVTLEWRYYYFNGKLVRWEDENHKVYDADETGNFIKSPLAPIEYFEENYGCNLPEQIVGAICGE
jgi:hypothetical protein